MTSVSMAGDRVAVQVRVRLEPAWNGDTAGGVVSETVAAGTAERQ